MKVHKAGDRTDSVNADTISIQSTLNSEIVDGP